MVILFANENFPQYGVQALRSLGHDVLTMTEAGLSGQAVPDKAVLELARDLGRAVLTLNRRHFIRLHLDDPNHSGIVVCTYDPDFEGQAQRIHGALAGLSSLTGHLIRVNRP